MLDYLINDFGWPITTNGHPPWISIAVLLVLAALCLLHLTGWSHVTWFWFWACAIPSALVLLRVMILGALIWSIYRL